MSTTRTHQGVRAFDTEWRGQELPPLTTADRVALRLGLLLILWGQRHAGRTDAAAEARRHLAAEHAAAARRDAFERRGATGHTW